MQHSGKIFEFFLIIFAECRSSGTRQRNLFFFKKKPSLSSATAQALGEATSKNSFFLFFPFPCKQQSIYISQTTNQQQYITNHIYISQTTKFVRNPQFITNHKFIVHKFTSSIHRNYSASGSRRLRPSVRSRRRSGCGWPDLRCRRPSDLVRRRPRCPLHKKEDIARE